MVGERRRRAVLRGLLLLRLRLNLASLAACVFYGLVFPFLLFAWSRSRIDADPERAMAGIALVGGVFVVFRFTAWAVGNERLSGIKGMLATTAVTRDTYVLSCFASGLGLGMVPLAGAICAAGVSSGRLPAGPGLVLPYGLFLIFLTALGVWIGSRGESTAMIGLLMNLLALSAVTFCPLLYPAERVPTLLSPVVAFLPPTLAADAMEAAWRAGVPSGGSTLGLAIWASALGWLSWRRFEF